MKRFIKHVEIVEFEMLFILRIGGLDQVIFPSGHVERT
jgi:hypothetical protein